MTSSGNRKTMAIMAMVMMNSTRKKAGRIFKERKSSEERKAADPTYKIYKKGEFG